MFDTTPLHHEAGTAEYPTAHAGYELPQLALLNRFIEASAGVDGIDLTSESAGLLIWLKTANSEYRLCLVDPPACRVTLQGGSLFPEPIEAIVSGSGCGGSMLRVGWIATGLQLEFSCSLPREQAMNVITSPIQRLFLQRGSQ